MIKKKNMKKICFALALPFAFLGAGFMGGSLPATDGASNNNKQDYINPISVYGSSFNDGISGEYSQSTPGWEVISEYNDSNALALIINTGEHFNQYNSNYYISENPYKTDEDDRILMLNSRKTLVGDNVSRRLAYKSNDITLNANSYYRLSVDALTSHDGKNQGEYDVKASIYVDGLKDAQDKEVVLGYEGVNNTSWATYYFYIATGSESQTVNLQLFLGGRENHSTGVVFFDKVYLEQFSENTFFNAAIDKEYNFTDSLDAHTTDTKFLVDRLQDEESDKELKLDMTDYNFDFEESRPDDFSMLGDAWTSSITPTSHAWIMPVVRGAQAEYFREQTMSSQNPQGYQYVGSDLSFDKSKGKDGENSNALVLFTDGQSHVSVKSKDITLKAHGTYKFSLRAKVSDIRSGNFTVSIKETDQIYEWYNIKSLYPTLASTTKTCATENSDNPLYNDYATIDIFVKCHNEYDTNVYLEIALGNENELAEGCVFIDNISVSQIDSASFSTDGNALTMKVASSDPDFTNSYFDLADSETARLNYPLKAQNYTANNGKYTESGVIYLKDEAHFNKMYSSYDWKGSFPKHPEGTNSVNNVYMMYNAAPSYQSLQTPSKTLTAGVWNEISFDYRTVSQASKDAEITIEIVDSNGMQLFYQKGISSYNWTKMKAYIKTNELVPLDVNVIVHFGENKTGEEMQGYVYLDNFDIKSDVTLPEVAPYKVDLTDMLSLDPTGSIGEGLTNSEAFSFEESSAVSGGIVNGQKNQFDGITVENGNILALITHAESKPTLTSKYAYSFAENEYYTLSFDLRTNFSADEDAIKENNKDHKCAYGVSVGLKDFSEITRLKSNEEFTHYTIYIKAPSNAVTTNLIFSLNSDCYDTTGAAYLANVKLEKSTSIDYTSASDSDEFNKTVFTSTYQNQGDNEKPEEPSEPTTPTDNTQLWVIIPSIFTAIALIGALAAVGLNKIKFKKREKFVGEAYDRKINVNHDAILIKAQAERDNEAKEIRDSIKALEEERETLELAHKDAVKAARQSGKGVTKEAEKEFKAYASKMARLNEKENILREQLDTTLSADYLISIEKRLADEEEKELRELEKIQAGKKSKLAQKEENNKDE